jgi:hypothetical protein
MLHELAHAANQNVFRCRAEDYLGDCVVAEAGFDLTAQIFGRIPFLDPQDPTSAFGERWPYVGLLNTNMCRGQNWLHGAKFDVHFTESNLKQFFDDTFWELGVNISGGMVVLPLEITEAELRPLYCDAVPASLEYWLWGSPYE